jgi:hypothetical protein
VALSGVQAYSIGFGFTLRVRLRTPLDSVGMRRMSMLITGYSGPDAGADAGQRLLLGIEFADGRRASNARPERRPPTDPQAPLLAGGRGGGTELAHDRVSWVTPLPPDGPLLVIVRCDALGIPESSVELDGGEIARAGRRATVLWPAPPPPTRREPEPPRLPGEGWFSRHG